ncbi:hypothetical protein BDF14DRAFT_1759616 [Spinellus fusiger]|nr:hypothetical protein BDF14DRAFT_1759616 [Spinellus fusiger]
MALPLMPTWKRNRVTRKLCLVLVLSIVLYMLAYISRMTYMSTESYFSVDRYKQLNTHGQIDTDVAQESCSSENTIFDTPASTLLSDTPEEERKKALQEALDMINTTDIYPPTMNNNLHKAELLSASKCYKDCVYKKPEDDRLLPTSDPKDPNEKYLSYIPHSGLHNQRISLINALLLAKNLGRTLLVPPVMLGEPIHWRNYNSLRSYHQKLSKTRLSECKQYLEPYYNKEVTLDSLPEKCKFSYRYTSLHWDRLFDMSTIKKTVNIRYKDDYEHSTLQQVYGIKESDIYHIKDTSLYEYRITDRKRYAKHRKYQTSIFIGDLAARTERLISFGSLFGSGRFQVTTPENLSMQQFLTRQFVLSESTLPELFSEANAIIQQLGGAQTYLSIHARVGDSIFERFSVQIMGSLWKNLEKYVPLVTSEGERKGPRVSTQSLDRATCFSPPTSSDKAVDWATKTVAPGRPLVFFMATDVMESRQHPLFKPIYEHFPCVVTLNDVFSYPNSSLNSLVNPTDGLRYGRFLVPFLDGLLASRAQEFTGSRWSTFSSYIEFIHNIFISS